MTRAIVFYAPNVHTGGGIVLLRALLSAWRSAIPLTVFLDTRARGQLVLPRGTQVSWVAPSVISRLQAELSLRKAAGSGDIVLCFHGLPPQLPTSARVVVFLQNRHYLDGNPLSQFVWKTRLRLSFERWVCRIYRHRVAEYIVQTPTMKRALTDWYAALSSDTSPRVRIIPFVDVMLEPRQRPAPYAEWDFVYVADGEPHKNHQLLLKAWRLLAQEGIRPSLALTLGQRDSRLKREVESACAEAGLRIRDLGHIPREEVMVLYAKCRALIFPSTSESFGLPLVEAAQVGIPILASELDFVRDVCVPTHTFDPASAVSIARAVKRFLGSPEPTASLRTATEFWSELLMEEPGRQSAAR